MLSIKLSYHSSVEACAFWTLFCLLRDLKPALTAYDEPAKTACQCLVARLQAFLDVAEDDPRFPRLCAIADALLTKLVEMWPADAEALPYYPAFQQRAQEHERTAPSAT
jgi:hypothetical protein